MTFTTGRPERIRGAFAAVPRTGFLPASRRDEAGFDAPLPIGHAQTNSQPTTVANMLELLDVPRGARVLDVGSGSGWTTALLAHLVGADGTVLGVELVPELRAFGAANLAAWLDGAVDAGAAEIRQAHADRLGLPDDGPFDRILVSAEARSLPDSLVEQLAPGGLLVIPVRGDMLRVAQDADGHVATTRHGTYRFVPLIEG